MSENESPGPDTHRGYLRAIVACFLVLLAAWGAGDVLMALTSKQAPALVTPVEFVEGLGMAMRRGFQYESTYVNSDGFRRTELPRVVPGEIRILALGDSVTFGTNLANGEDWPGALEKELRARGVPATVMNAGNPGVQTSYMFGALKYYVARMKVDLVLVHNTGNMLAIYSMDKGLTPFEIGERLFPDHRRGSLRPRPACPDTSVVRAPASEAVSLPAILKRLIAHSPAIAELLSKLKDRSAKPAPSVQSIPDACFPSASPAGYMARDMLAMGQMIEYADRERIPIVFLRPTYVFNFAAREARETGPPTFLAYKGSWAGVDRVDRMFDFFEQTGRVRLVDPVARLSRERGAGLDASKLYLDYTHFSPEGARLVSKAIADDLLERKLVSPVTGGPWLHPAEPTGSRDLRYRDLPGSLSVAGVLWAGIFVSIVTFIVGLASQLVIPAIARAPFAAASMVGFFVAAAVAMIANNFSTEAYRPWLVVAGMAVAALAVFAVRLRFQVRRAALVALGGGALTAASAAIILAFLNHAVWKDPRHLQYIRTEIAWAEYLVPEKDRVLQIDVARRQAADGVARPHMVPNIVSAHSQVVQPAAPGMAVFAARLAGAPIQDAVIGVWAAFCGAIAMLALGGVWALRRRPALAALVALLALATFLVATLLLPTPLTMALTAALVVAFMAVHRTEFTGPGIRIAMLFVAGAVAYVLPPRAYIAGLAIVVLLAGVRACWVSRSLREGARECVVVLVVLLAARALLFDTTVVDARLYRLLGVNHLEFVPFFL